MKKSLLLSIFLVLSLFELSAVPRSKQELLQPDNFIYDALTALSMENGIILMNDQAPISIKEALFYLESIDYEGLSDSGKKYYNMIKDYTDTPDVAFTCDLFTAAVRPELNFEAYYKSDENVDWNYDYHKKKPLIFLPMGFQIGDYVSMVTDIYFSENRATKQASNNYTNLTFNPKQMDVNFPSFGYLSTGWSFTDKVHGNFQIGLGPQSVGRSVNGSVIMSEYFTGASFANLELFSNNIKYNMNITQFNVDKYMYSHRIGFRVFDKLEFQAQESMLVYAPLELRFLNPLTIFHGYSPWLDYEPELDYHESHTCAYMCFTFSYTPIKYLRLYGIFAQDQFQTQYELKNFPNDCTPNAVGGQLGIESYIPHKEGYFHTWLEGYYAQPYLYIKEGPNWSLVRTYRENIGPKQIFYEWVGSPFGPDTISGELNFGYIVPSKYELTLSYLISARGEMSGTNIFTDKLHWGGHHTEGYDEGEWPYPNSGIQGQEEAKRRQALITPTGTPEYVNRISLFGSYSLFDWMTINGQIGFTYIFNTDHIKNAKNAGFELTTSVNIKLPSGFNYEL